VGYYGYMCLFIKFPIQYPLQYLLLCANAGTKQKTNVCKLRLQRQFLGFMFPQVVQRH